MTERVSTFHTATRTHSTPSPGADFLKRTLDLGISALGLLLLWPVMAFIAILIKRDSPGPVFYRGPRAGKGGKPFFILKFRTMHERPETYEGPRVTAQDDPRITALGKWLRDTKLNELPQLWNVLKGEMSLVGPRPEDPEIAAAWPVETRQEVLSVRPGITSPASVLYRKEENLLSNEKVMHTYMQSVLPSKLRLDQLYVRNRSLWVDLDILFWTALLLVLRLGSYDPPEKLLFLGPINQLMRRYVNWFFIDTLITFIAIGAAGFVWRAFGPLRVGWPLAIPFAIFFAVLFSVSGTLFGVHRIAWTRASPYDAFDLVWPAGFATVTSLLINEYVSPRSLPFDMILAAAALAFTGFVATRYRTRLITGFASRWLRVRGGASATRERLLIIGSGYTGQFMAWMLSNHRTPGGLQVTGFVDDDLYKQGTRIRGVKVVGETDDLPQLVEALDIGILVFAIHNIAPNERQRLLKICARTSAQVVFVPDILGTLNAVAALNQEPITNYDGVSSPRDAARRVHLCPLVWDPAHPGRRLVNPAGALRPGRGPAPDQDPAPNPAQPAPAAAHLGAPCAGRDTTG